MNKIAEGRIARNAERQRENEMKKLEKLKKRNSVADSEAIQETEFILKELTEIIDNKGMVSIPCQDCQDCRDKNKLCSCQCKACTEVSMMLNYYLFSSLAKALTRLSRAELNLIIISPTYDGRRPSIEDDLRWKTTFDGRRPSMEDDFRWKMTYD